MKVTYDKSRFFISEKEEVETFINDNKWMFEKGNECVVRACLQKVLDTHFKKNVLDVHVLKSGSVEVTKWDKHPGCLFMWANDYYVSFWDPETSWESIAKICTYIVDDPDYHDGSAYLQIMSRTFQDCQ